LPVVVLTLIVIIYSRKLSFDDYGKFQSIWMYANIVNVIISFGLPAVILSTNLNFLFSFLRNNQKKIKFFYSLLWVCGLTLFFFVAKNFNTSLKFLLIAFIVIQNISTIAETLLIKRQGEKISFAINFIYSAFFLGWHIYVLQINYSLDHLIRGICILSIAKLIAMFLVPAKKEIHEKTIDEKHFFKHWAYLGITDIIGVFAKWMDKIILWYLLTATDFAIFFNGSIEIPLFGLLISVTGSFLLIEISQNTKLTGKIIKLYRESFTMLSTIVFPLFFFLFFFREELFSFIFKDKYNASLPIFVICLFGLPLRINNYSTILQCFAKGNKILLGSILDIVIALILMLILYPLIGTRGLALAIVLSTFCQVIYYLWHSAKTLNTSIFQLIPLLKLITRFGILFALYFVLFFVLSGVELKIKLLTGAIVTTLIVSAGMAKYFKAFFKKEKEYV
jgi:O-antigen/teichoic acid export membrane protein